MTKIGNFMQSWLVCPCFSKHCCLTWSAFQLHQFYVGCRNFRLLILNQSWSCEYCDLI